MSLRDAKSFTTTAHWVLSWCACYTRDLPSQVAAARRDELTSDLHEHALWADEAGWSATRLRRDIVRRLLAGTVHDLTWRAHQLGRSAASDRLHAATVRTAQRITLGMLALGITLILLGGYTYVRIIRSIIIDDLGVSPRLSMLIGLLTALSMIGTALVAKRRTRIIGAFALAPPALLLGYFAVTSLSRTSATVAQITYWANETTATAGSLSLLAIGIGISALLGLAAATIWWWPSTPTPTPATAQARAVR